jgi:hypothetical protein
MRRCADYGRAPPRPPLQCGTGYGDIHPSRNSQRLRLTSRSGRGEVAALPALELTEEHDNDNDEEDKT